MQFNNRDYLDNWQHPRLVVGPTQGGDFMIKHVHEDSCDFTLFLVEPSQQQTHLSTMDMEQ